jgi:hypothetical protein
MKAKKKPVEKLTPADLGVDFTPQLEVLRVRFLSLLSLSFIRSFVRLPLSFPHLDVSTRREGLGEEEGRGGGGVRGTQRSMIRSC